jgi:hypothetical protein
MRLINTDTLELESFFGEIVPAYAILSHTWTDDEVSFQDMSYARRERKDGFRKIVETCKLANCQGLNMHGLIPAVSTSLAVLS